MHVHVGPEFIRRRYSAASLAHEARSEGIGVVMKNHFQPTTAWVSMIREPDDQVPLIGAVALNLGCGGIDSHGIRSALSGWKTDTTASDPDTGRFVVWMPTVCADAHLELFQRHDMDVLWGVDPKYTIVIEKGDGLRLTAPDGELIGGLSRALDIIAEYDLVLASGHLDGGDTQLLVKTARAAGVNRIVLTHPLWQATKLKPEVLATLYRDYGAYSELSFINLAMNGIDDLTIDDFVEVIRAVGAEGVISVLGLRPDLHTECRRQLPHLFRAAAEGRHQRKRPYPDGGRQPEQDVIRSGARSQPMMDLLVLNRQEDRSRLSEAVDARLART